MQLVVIQHGSVQCKSKLILPWKSVGRSVGESSERERERDNVTFGHQTLLVSLMVNRQQFRQSSVMKGGD